MDCPWNSPGNNTGVGCHPLLQGIFLTQGSNPGLLHWRQVQFKKKKNLSKRSNTWIQVKTLAKPKHFFKGALIQHFFVVIQLLSSVWLFVTPSTLACQALVSKEFSRQEHWNGLPFFPPGIFLDQGLNSCLLHWQTDSWPLRHQGSSKG